MIFGIEIKMFILLWAIFLLTLSVASRKCKEWHGKIEEYDRYMNKEGV